MAELGRIDRPEAGDFHGRRKLYCVPNIYPVPDAPAEFNELLDRFWDEAIGQIGRLELAGKVAKVFCEGIVDQGGDAIEALSKVNDRAAGLVRRKAEEGATVVPLEEGVTFGQFLDWANCLRVVRTEEVFTKILGFFNELSEKRTSQILETIGSRLGEGEAGLLIMSDEYRARLQFPSDIEVFLVTPRTYDDILRWMREKVKEMGGA